MGLIQCAQQVLHTHRTAILFHDITRADCYTVIYYFIRLTRKMPIWRELVQKVETCYTHDLAIAVKFLGQAMSIVIFTCGCFSERDLHFQTQASKLGHE